LYQAVTGEVLGGETNEPGRRSLNQEVVFPSILNTTIAQNAASTDSRITVNGDQDVED